MKTKIKLQLKEKELIPKETLKLVPEKKSFILSSCKLDLNRVAKKNKQEDMMRRISKIAANELNLYRNK